MPKKFKIFIIHYKKLIERKRYLFEQMSNNVFDFEFIENFDRDDYTMGEYIYNDKLWSERINEIKTEKYNPTFGRLKDSEICNSLSHLSAFQKIVDYNLDYGLILEDDIILSNDFKEKIESIDLPENFDFIFLGSSYPMQMLDEIHNSKSIRISNGIYLKVPGSTRTVDSYLVSKKTCERILNSLKEISLPFDHELNYFIKKMDLRVYWCEPGITQQGSMLGVYNSAIR